MALELLGIIIKPNQSTCYGQATIARQELFSTKCGQVEHYCTIPAEFSFVIYFYVDAENIPRPLNQPLPTVTIDLKFIVEDQIVYQKLETDTNPTYVGPGEHLQPSFGTSFPINTDRSGILEVNLGLNDNGTIVSYVDSIECIIVPCV